MLPIDMLLLKITEEASEVSKEVALVLQLASKAIRFGEDSWHPRDDTQRTNEAMLLYSVKQMDTEVHDLHAAIYLYLYQKYQFTAQESDVQTLAKAWFPSEDSRQEAVRKLTKFDRLLDTTFQKGTISRETLESLQNTLVQALGYLRDME